METKASLKAQIAAAKKAGKSMQTVGRLQYKLNQLNKDSKGTAVKTKTGVLKSKTGVVRQKDASKKVRQPAVKKLTMDRNPNNVVKAVAKKKADKPKSNVTVTPYKAAKITKGPQSGTAVNVLKGRPKNKPYVSTNPQVVKNLAAAKKKEDAQKKLQAARRKLSTSAKVKARQKDYRNNKTSPY
tara:strand:- start:560 stop:1111 length:552 start_codon:yes stop_codon:yes gene_type:complete